MCSIAVTSLMPCPYISFFFFSCFLPKFILRCDLKELIELFEKLCTIRKIKYTHVIINYCVSNKSLDFFFRFFFLLFLFFVVNSFSK